MSLLNVLATVTLKAASGFVEDDVVNTFSFQCDGTTATATKITQLQTAIAAFYNTNQSTTRAPAYYLAHSISRSTNATLVRYYDVEDSLDGSPHGSPLDTKMFTLAAAASNPDLPAEAAVVLTTRGTSWATALVETTDGSDAGSLVDRPRQRRSGRIYFGPLNSAASTEPSDGTFARPVSAVITTFLDAAEDLQDAVQANGDNWAVWSRVDAAMRNVTDAQMDNAFDTMRSRGPAATSRTTRAL